MKPIKMCMVCDPENDSKLMPGSYSGVFKEEFHALIKRFNCKSFITGTGSIGADKIDADVIFFFDPHATHHVNIRGLANHPAIKIEFWNDMHQEEFKGVYMLNNKRFHKLGITQRANRAKERGTNYIVAPVKEVFFKRFAEHFGTDAEKMLWHFPHAPIQKAGAKIQLSDRKQTVLGNGATHGWPIGYTFREWAFKQPEIEFKKHTMFSRDTPRGTDYGKFLSSYAGALALCTEHPVPKYSEIPIAGCLMFAEYHKECEELGFKDYETCIYVNRDNFKQRVGDFLSDIPSYQSIADAGRKLMEENYTAIHFADFIYNKINLLNTTTLKENENDLS